jgi:hypothetical protein
MAVPWYGNFVLQMLLDLFQSDIAKGDLDGPGAGTLQRNQAVRFELAVIIFLEDSRA